VKKAPILAAVLMTVLLTAGCASSSNDSGNTATRGEAGAPAAAPGKGDLSYNGAGGTDANKTPQDPDAQVKTDLGDRSIVYNASITVRVDNVAIASTKVHSLMDLAGGFLSNEKSVDSDGQQTFLTVRIPSAKFTGTLNDIAKLGTELSREVNADDVTEEAIDLDSRIAVLQASVADLQRHLEKVDAIPDILQYEQALTSRQQELASLEAKKRHLDDLVTFSTIMVSLVGPTVVVESPKKELPGFLSGLETGWTAFVDFLRIASATIGFLLPFLILIAIPIVTWRIVRRVRRRPVAAPAAPAAVAPAADETTEE
jgi:hypothetical protein